MVRSHGANAFSEESHTVSSGGLGLYETLGVSKKATDEEIRRAFRKLALAYHPDRNKEPDAPAKFRKAQYAQKMLLDPNKRRIYDKHGLKGLKLAEKVGDKNVDIMLAMDSPWGRCVAIFCFVLTGCGCCCICCCNLCFCRCCCNYCCGGCGGLFNYPRVSESEMPADWDRTSPRYNRERGGRSTEDVVNAQPKRSRCPVDSSDGSRPQDDPTDS